MMNGARRIAGTSVILRHPSSPAGRRDVRQKRRSDQYAQDEDDDPHTYWMSAPTDDVKISGLPPAAIR